MTLSCLIKSCGPVMPESHLIHSASTPALTGVRDEGSKMTPSKPLRAQQGIPQTHFLLYLPPWALPHTVPWDWFRAACQALLPLRPGSHHWGGLGSCQPRVLITTEFQGTQLVPMHTSPFLCGNCMDPPLGKRVSAGTCPPLAGFPGP